MDQIGRGTMDTIIDDDGKEVVFMAGSQSFDVFSDPGLNGVEFVRTRFKNNELKCKSGFCKRLSLNVWSKVLLT